MKKTQALIVMHIVLIIISAVFLVIAFLAGLDVIEWGGPLSSALIFVGMILNIIGNVITLNRVAKQHSDEET